MALIKLFANWRTVAATNEIPLHGQNVRDLVIELVRQKPTLETYLLQDGHLRPHVLITINGNPTQDEQAPVEEQDTLAIFPPIAGG